LAFEEFDAVSNIDLAHALGKSRQLGLIKEQDIIKKFALAIQLYNLYESTMFESAQPDSSPLFERKKV
jgi:hypothetical protein